MAGFISSGLCTHKFKYWLSAFFAMAEFYYVCTVPGISQEDENINKVFAHYDFDVRVGPGFSPDGVIYFADNKRFIAGMYSNDRRKAVPVAGEIISLDAALNMQSETEKIFHSGKPNISRHIREFV